MFSLDTAWHIRNFATKIQHGDEVHRQWLLDAAEAYIQDQDPMKRGAMPPPRDATTKTAFDTLPDDYEAPHG